MVINAETPMPACAFPPPRSTTIHHGHPMSLSSIVPKSLYSRSCSQGIEGGGVEWGDDSRGKTGARCIVGAECATSGSVSIAWTGLWSEMMISGVEENSVI